MPALEDYNKLMAISSYQKIGFHVSVGGNRNGIGNYYSALDQAGIPINLMSADDYGACKEVADISRASGIPHVVAYRVTTRGQGDGFDYDVPLYGANPANAASIHWQAVRAKLPPGDISQGGYDREKVWIVICNEVDKNQSDWLGQFAYEYSLLTRADGFKAVFFGFASGEPEYEHWETPGMQRFLRECAKFPHLLGVSLHEYSYSIDDIKNAFGYLVGRVATHLYDACDELQIARPTVLITEWGWQATDVPSVNLGLKDIKEIANFYSPFPQILGANIWYLGSGFGNIADQVQPYIDPVTDLSLVYEAPGVVPPDPPVPPTAPETLEQHLWRVSVEEQIRTGLRLNPDAALQKALLDKSLEDPSDPVNIVINEVFTNYSGTDYATQAGERLESGERYTSYAQVPHWNNVIVITKPSEPVPVPPVEPPAPGVFKLTHKPTFSTKITQRFGANPENYAQFGLPGHDGVDIAAFDGAPLNAAAPGRVYRIHRLAQDGWSNYGNHVRIVHDDDYKTIYSHAAQISGEIVVGGDVPGGALLGLANSTGNSSGNHLHFGMKHPPGLPGWPFNFINPEPFLFALADYQLPPGTGGGTDIMPYFTGGFNGKGVLYEVQTQNGGQQRHQTHVEGTTFYHTKGGDGPNNPSEWEQLRYDSNHIWRFTDTSPGNGQYYQLQDGGQDWSKWAPRHWTVGNAFRRMPLVTFHNKSDCGVIGEPAVQDTWLKLVGVYNEYKFYTNVVLKNVIKLEWLTSPNSDPIESYWYAVGYGLVGWQGRNRIAAISEIHAPGARPDNVRETIACL